MIKIENGQLIFQNQNPVHALKNINININKGDWISILGPSGSGKTSLLNVIGGIEKLSEGTIKVFGENISKIDSQSYRRNTIGYIYQDFRLLNQFSVLENVMLPQLPYQKRKALEESAKEVLIQLEMGHRLHHLPGELSGGEQQRTAIARAILNRPSILLCDEPTGNLDSINRENIMGVLTNLNKLNITIILVTHDLEVAKYGDRILYMRDGVLQEKVIV
ncbi:ABC transporter ATP-binding protein [Heyndrickxia shackletonii]|uniref:ABC transporter ATP-binding protein n=1 Tax=Heyndrickxia shackletonii TaxID=157838 RepID=A0A0Q3TG98_9BACI|nr:ABC transporter ATP-binding protein [Heyndrickxia shackletonii]KQL52673.1 ABC transporter ATP-binding protein [Heyndrickxia shackletonii]NEZ01700.1 ABC transporter ATP-binding protein [Heyndrickxia shackletonii]